MCMYVCLCIGAYIHFVEDIYMYTISDVSSLLRGKEYLWKSNEILFESIRAVQLYDNLYHLLTWSQQKLVKNTTFLG